MHICSDKSLQRPGYSYVATPNGGFVGYPEGMKLYVNWRHVDGPLLHCTSGTLHWLTWRERMRLFFGLTTIDEIDEARR